MDDLILTAHLWLPELLVMIGLTLVSGFFSASETAIFYISHDELRGFHVGKPRERQIAELLQDADRLLTAVLFWNLVTNLSYFAVSILVAQSLNSEGRHFAAATFGFLSLCGIVLFGEVLPKSVAVVFHHSLATHVVWPLAFAVRIFDPVSPYFRNIARLARRAFWPHVPRELYLETDDLERAVENSKQSKEVIAQERQVLHNILDLSEIPVEEAMRPRGSYAMVSSPVEMRQLKQSMKSHEYVAISKNGTEDVESAIALFGHSSIPEEHIEQIAEGLIHVPWCADLAHTLQLMRDRICNIASVVNEYGETIGLLTYEDIIDTILMPQPSRAKRLLHREPVLEVAPGSYHVEAITSLRYLCNRLAIDYEPNSDGQITVAGMLHEELERIPVVGDECYWRGFKIRVIDLSERGQMRVMVSKHNL